MINIGLTAACGTEESKNLRGQNHKQGAEGAAADATQSADSTASPRLANDSTDQVVSTLVVDFGGQGTALTDPTDGSLHWAVDMEQRQDVAGSVAPLKYLKIKGDLSVPSNAENKAYDVGCLYVDLKDNVYYREQTWLRIATTGIAGVKYNDVKLPLSADLGGFKTVPELEDSITLQTFTSNSLKKFDSTICFRLDFSNAPADDYKGQIIVQYLRPGDVVNPKPCDVNPNDDACKPKVDPTPAPVSPAPTAFACAQAPAVLKAGQSVDLAWTAGTYSGLDIQLAADTAAYTGALGTLKTVSANKSTYTAPAKVPANVRILATARPIGVEQLPAFCQINLVADEAIGTKDDGEIEGMTGNVYKIAVNTAKLPDLDKMTAVDNVVVPNLDIPQRSFSTGFPGVKDLVEWFAIKFRSRITIAASTQCTFRVNADDGANLYIDGQKVVDNDGVHAPTVVTGTALSLAKGDHDFRVDYYQGPRYLIALQVYWKCGNAADFSIIPPSAFLRPLN